MKEEIISKKTKNKKRAQIKKEKKHSRKYYNPIKYFGRKRSIPISINVVNCHENTCKIHVLKSVKDCLAFISRKTTTWININGVSDLGIIKDVGKYFHIHPVILADISNTYNRPKLELYNDNIFIEIKMAYLNGKTDVSVTIEQLSLIIGRDFLITFEEKPTAVLKPVYESLKLPENKMHSKNSDYLAYSIIDTTLNNYFIILEAISDYIQKLENKILSKSNENTLDSIYKLSRELISLKKAIWPTREVINDLQKLEHKLLDKSMDIYLRDLYERTVQIIETIESLREIVTGMVNLYLSQVSNRLNPLVLR